MEKFFWQFCWTLLLEKHGGFCQNLIQNCNDEFPAGDFSILWTGCNHFASDIANTQGVEAITIAVEQWYRSFVTLHGVVHGHRSDVSSESFCKLCKSYGTLATLVIFGLRDQILISFRWEFSLFGDLICDFSSKKICFEFSWIRFVSED